MVWAPETTWDKRFADIQRYFMLNNKLPDASSKNDYEKKLDNSLRDEKSIIVTKAKVSENDFLSYFEVGLPNPTIIYILL